MPEKQGKRVTAVSFHIPRNLLEALDKLVEKGAFNNRSEAIRTAIIMMLRDFSKLQLLEPQPEVGYR